MLGWSISTFPGSRLGQEGALASGISLLFLGLSLLPLQQGSSLNLYQNLASGVHHIKSPVRQASITALSLWGSIIP
jgi:hypothetical protein